MTGIKKQKSIVRFAAAAVADGLAAVVERICGT